MSVSSRRAFLRFLAASPLLLQQGGLDRASDALDVFDFQTAAQKAIPPAHWGYLMTGVDGEETLKANRDGYARYQLKTRRFVDVSRMDMSVELFGARFNSPIVLCPLGSQRAFHRDGEAGLRALHRRRGIFRFSRRKRRLVSRTSSKPAAGQSGISSIQRTTST